MTAESVASFLQEASHPAHGDRRWLRSLAGARGGVIPTTATFTDLKVTQRGAGANMSVDVAEGSVLVAGTESTYQGVYHGENQGVQNVTITAANATNPRRDLIVARIKDSEYGVAVTDVFSIEAVDGTPAGSPADPTVPDNCVVLARVAVAANATSITNANITDLRDGYAAVTGSSTIGNQVKAVAAGGIVPCQSTFRPTKGLYEGLTAFDTDVDRAVIYNGSAWVGLGAMTAPPPQFFTGSVSGGTQTGTFAAIITQNSVLTAPYPLTMIVEVFGDCGANAATNAVHLEVSDEAGTSIVSGSIITSGAIELRNKAATESKGFAVMGKKDYTAGQTCGFRFRYRVDTSNIHIGAHAKVTFWPKAS